MSTTNDDVIDGTDVAETPGEPSGKGGLLPHLTKVPGGIPDLNERLAEVALLPGADEDGVLMRVQPEFYFPTGRAQRTYVRWTGVQWGIRATAEQLTLFRHDLDTFVAEWVRRQQGAGGGA